MNNRTLILRPSELKEGDVVDFVWLSDTGDVHRNNATVYGSGNKLSFNYVNEGGERCHMIYQHDPKHDIFKYITNVMRHDEVGALTAHETDKVLNELTRTVRKPTTNFNELAKSINSLSAPENSVKKDRYYTDDLMVIKNPKIRNGIISFKIKGGTGGMTFKKFASFRKCTKKEVRKFIF